MKMLKRILVLIVIVCSYSVNAQTVDEIISNYFENTGGVENWEKIEGMKLWITANAQGMEISIEQVILKNGKTSSTIKFQGREIKQGVFDGEVLWSTNFMTGKAEKSDEETVNMVKNQLSEFPDPFLNYKEKGFTAELMDTETVDGAETFKIKLTTTPNIIEGKEVPNITYYFFDKENFVPIQVHKEIMDGPGKGMTSEQKMSDYQEAGGVYMPYSMTEGVKDQPGQSLTIEKIEINPTIDDSEFAFPEEVPEEN